MAGKENPLISSLEQRTIPQIADAIGLKRGRLSSFGPCPLCSADKRSRGDTRGPLGIAGSQKGVHCWECDRPLSIVDLVAVLATGRQVKEFTGAGDWDAFRAYCEARGIADGGNSSWSGRNAPRTSQRAPRSPAPRNLNHVSANTPRSGRPAPSGGDGKQSAPRDRGDSGRAEKGGFPWEPDLYARTPEILFSEEGAHVLAYLHVRGFLDETIQAWSLGAYLKKDGAGKVVEEWVVIPLLDEHGRPVNCRFRSVPGPCLYCYDPARDVTAGEAPRGAGCDHCKGKDDAPTGLVQKKYRPCTGRPLPLFGAHLLSKDRSLPVLIIEGELDTIAAWQYGYTESAVSSTAGAGTFKEEWADLLEPYKSFLLCHDDDEAGHAGAEKVATLLGRYRCSRAIFPRNDLAGCLEEKITREEVERALDNAKGMITSTLQKAAHYQEDLEILLDNPQKLHGLPTGSRRLDEKLKGFRPGLTVVTGDTGSGKTTWTTWQAYRLAKMGVGVMVTSYEQRPIGTIMKLLRMELEDDFTKRTRDERAAALGKIDQMPLWILDHYGEQSYLEVIETIRYAIRRHGCRFFLLDHLGFMIPDEEDERRAVERVIRDLTILANTEEIMLWVICHPSNEYVKQRRRVMLVDLKGASAIRQDVSDGIVIEQGKPSKDKPWFFTKVHLDKVRSEFGQKGTVEIPFDPIALHFNDSPDNLPTYRGGGIPIDPNSFPEEKPRKKKESGGGKEKQEKG